MRRLSALGQGGGCDRNWCGGTVPRTGRRGRCRHRTDGLPLPVLMRLHARS